VPLEIPEGGEFESESPGAPDMSSGTPDSPVHQTRGAFGCPFAESRTWSFYWLSVNLLHLNNLYTWAN
jgi:hypothetical protein